MIEPTVETTPAEAASPSRTHRSRPTPKKQTEKPAKPEQSGDEGKS